MTFNLYKNKKQNLVYGLKSNNQTLIGLYVGIWCGDGTQYYDVGYCIKICCHSDNKKMINFFLYVLDNLFGKTVVNIRNEERHRTLLRFYSKYIYTFVYDYICHAENKTYSVGLKKPILDYSEDFLKGFILGLTLTDGYLKKTFSFNVTSDKLAKNCFDILKMWGLKPKLYIHNRSKYGWKNLHMVRLNTLETRILLDVLNSIIKKLDYLEDFSSLKYE